MPATTANGKLCYIEIRLSMFSVLPIFTPRFSAGRSDNAAMVVSHLMTLPAR
ncbi:MAG TPA: hypothetical protein VK208_18580 [Pyrinomonadaceae bacterium]|nr:hypothetical protein [Pyrinomonadaceae bacterium]